MENNLLGVYLVRKWKLNHAVGPAICTMHPSLDCQCLPVLRVMLVMLMKPCLAPKRSKQSFVTGVRRKNGWFLLDILPCDCSVFCFFPGESHLWYGWKVKFPTVFQSFSCHLRSAEQKIRTATGGLGLWRLRAVFHQNWAHCRWNASRTLAGPGCGICCDMVISVTMVTNGYHPRCSTYGIFSHKIVSFVMANVGEYSIYGASGLGWWINKANIVKLWM